MTLIQCHSIYTGFCWNRHHIEGLLRQTLRQLQLGQEFGVLVLGQVQRQPRTQMLWMAFPRPKNKRLVSSLASSSHFEVDFLKS